MNFPELVRVLKSKITQRDGYPGESVQSNVQGYHAMDSEVYGLPGVVCIPPENVRMIYVPYGNSRRGACVGGHNYQLSHEAVQGDTIIFSTTADGKTIKATIHLHADGKISVVSDSDVSVATDGKITADGTAIELNGNTKALVTHAELNTALQGFITALNLAFAAKLDGGGTSGTLSLNISTSATTTVKTGG
jgi:hypothetical protein